MRFTCIHCRTLFAVLTPLVEWSWSWYLQYGWLASLLPHFLFYMANLLSACFFLVLLSSLLALHQDVDSERTKLFVTLYLLVCVPSVPLYPPPWSLCQGQGYSQVIIIREHVAFNTTSELNVSEFINIWREEGRKKRLEGKMESMSNEFNHRKHSPLEYPLLLQLMANV